MQFEFEPFGEFLWYELESSELKSCGKQLRIARQILKQLHDDIEWVFAHDDTLYSDCDLLVTYGQYCSACMIIEACMDGSIAILSALDNYIQAGKQMSEGEENTEQT